MCVFKVCVCEQPAVSYDVTAQQRREMKLKFSVGILIYHPKDLYSLCLCVRNNAHLHAVFFRDNVQFSMYTQPSLSIYCHVHIRLCNSVTFQSGCNSLEHLSVNHICMPKGSHAFWKSNSKMLDWLTHRDRAQENYQFRLKRSIFFGRWLHMLMQPGPILLI